MGGKTRAEFIKSKQLRRRALDDSIHVAQNSPDSIAIVCDASVPSPDTTTLQSVAGWDCYYLNERLTYEKWSACGMATSDDAETAAISHGIASISHLMQDLSSIHI